MTKKRRKTEDLQTISFDKLLEEDSSISEPLKRYLTVLELQREYNISVAVEMGKRISEIENEAKANTETLGILKEWIEENLNVNSNNPIESSRKYKRDQEISGMPVIHPTVSFGDKKSEKCSIVEFQDPNHTQAFYEAFEALRSIDPDITVEELLKFVTLDP